MLYTIGVMQEGFASCHRHIVKVVSSTDLVEKHMLINNVEDALPHLLSAVCAFVVINVGIRQRETDEGHRCLVLYLPDVEGNGFYGRGFKNDECTKMSER